MVVPMYGCNSGIDIRRQILTSIDGYSGQPLTICLVRDQIDKERGALRITNNGYAIQEQRSLHYMPDFFVGFSNQFNLVYSVY